MRLTRGSAKRTSTGANARGYTLMEVLISMVVLMIAFLAIIAVQTSALQGYVSSRDNMAAIEIGRRVADLMSASSQSWRQGAYTGNVLYSGGIGAPFDTTDPVADMLANPWTWVPLHITPVDTRLGRRETSPEHVGGRYCVYARGGFMERVLTAQFDTGGGLENSGVIQAQIAVVYPGANATMPACADPAITGNLDIPSDTDPVPPLESLGLRSVYIGTTIVRRDHLLGN